MIILISLFFFYRPTVDESLVKGLKEGTGDLDGTIITRFALDKIWRIILCHAIENKKINISRGFVIAMWKYLPKIGETFY